MAKSKKHKELEEYLKIEIRKENVAGLYELKDALEACDKDVAIRNALRLTYQINLIEEYGDKIMRTILQ